MALLIGLIVWALIVTVGYSIGQKKGRAGAGVLLAAFLGAAGLVVIACLPPNQEEAEVQRKYDIQQAEAAGYPPPPDYPYPPRRPPDEPDANPSVPPPRQF